MRLNTNVTKLVEDYARLKEKNQLKELDSAIEITPHFLGRHNDYIQIYEQKSDEGIGANR